MRSGNPQEVIFNLPWPNALEYVVGVIAWSPEECVVVTSHGVYRVNTPYEGRDQGTVSVRKIEGR